MLTGIFLFLLFVALGAGCLFLAFNKHSRREASEQLWMGRSARNAEEAGTAKAMVILAPLLAGILIISGVVAVFLIWLLK